MIFNSLQKSCYVAPTRAPRKMAFLRFFEVQFNQVKQELEAKKEKSEEYEELFKVGNARINLLEKDLENEKKTKKEKNEEAFKLKERLIGVQEQLKIKENEIKILQNTVSSSTEELKFEHYQKREESEMMGNQFKQEIGKLQKN